MKSLHVWIGAILLVAASHAQAAEVIDVLVLFNPPAQTVPVDSVFTVDLLADISTPVVGWGLDLTIASPSILSLVAPPIVPNPPWFAGVGGDGDGLSGLANPFPPTNGSVSGDGVLLATLTFHADMVGETNLFLSVSLNDPSEGFALDLVGEANVAYKFGNVIVAPEPATLFLMGLAAILLLWRYRSPQARLIRPF